jgi:NarL family two-component system response regulator LiaR
MCAAIRILIADDHPVVRRGLRALIADESDMELVGEAADGMEAVLKARALAPSVIVLDLDMPRLDGLAALRQIMHEQPGARVLLFSGLPADGQLIEALQAGALGYLRKEASPTQIIDAIRAVQHGRSPLDPALASQLLHRFSRPLAPTTSNQTLTKSEITVLKYVAQGLSNQEIAVTLLMSERTVGNHISNILSKLHLSNRTQVALYALRTGLATLEQHRYEVM